MRLLEAKERSVFDANLLEVGDNDAMLEVTPSLPLD